MVNIGFSIFVDAMRTLFKYLFIACLMLFAFGAKWSQDSCAITDLNDSWRSLRDLCDECAQYNHSTYQHQRDIYAPALNSSVNLTSRIQSGNKRYSSSNKCHYAALKSGKDCLCGTVPAYISNKHFHIASYAQHQHQLVWLCKLVI